VNGLSENYPLISTYKKPQWYPFTSIKTVPQVFLPHRNLLEQYFKEISEEILNFSNLNLEILYWYLLLGKYLGVNLHKLPLKEEIYKLTKKCSIETEEQLGFKFYPYSGESPDIWSTNFALVIFHLLGKLEDYLYQNFDLNRKTKIMNFILSCKRSDRFVHCKKNCEVCKKTSEQKTLFHVLDILLLLGGDGIHAYRNVILSSLKSMKLGNVPQNVFRLLDLRFLGSYADVTDDQLSYFESFQKEDGGFSFSSSKTDSTINETFWIVYLFESYRFMIDYNPGKIYSYLVHQIQKINPVQDARNPLKLMEFAKVTIMLTSVWENLVDDLESMMFTWLDNPNIRFDLNKLSSQAGILDAEHEILLYLNQKYKISLKIVDNESRFIQFLNQLDPLDKFFAKFIYRRVQKYSSLNISEIISNYNRNKPKATRVNEEILENLLNLMMREDFFVGKIVVRKRVFRRTMLFNRDAPVSKLVTCNKRVSYESISAEKRKLSELKDDIYNMHREIVQSSELIMREVESLIFAGEIEYAELRLKNNIKKALLDAEFFNQNIHQQLEEFEFINAPEAVSAYLYDWITLYDNLQSQYQKVNLIMLEKIRESQKLRDQKTLLDKLETDIDTNISELHLAFSVFEEIFRSNLGKQYVRENVKQLEEELNSLSNKAKTYDHQIVDLSQQISLENRKVKSRRKKIIEKWVSQKEIFDQQIAFYLEGFQIWHQELEFIDSKYHAYTDMVSKNIKQIQLTLQDKNYKKTKYLLDAEFSKIVQTTDTNFKEFMKKITGVIRNRKKLYLLLNTLEKEWIIQKKLLETLITNQRKNQKLIVESDKYEKHKDDFIQLVTDKISYLDSSVQAFQDQINKQLTDRSIPQYSTIDDQFKYLQNLLNQAKKDIQQTATANSKKFKEFMIQAESSLTLWAGFNVSYEKRLAEIREEILDDVVRIALIVHNIQNSTNRIDLNELAEQTGLTRKNIRKRIETMIGFSKISGELIKGTAYLVIHNDEWRKNQRLRLFIQGESRELDTFTDRIIQLFKNAIEHKAIDSSFEEMNDIIEKYYSHLSQTKNSIKLKVKELKLDNNNELYTQNFDVFKERYQTSKEKIDAINLKIASSMKSYKIAEQTLNKLKDSMESWSFNIEFHMDDHKTHNYEKNKQWIDSEYRKLEDKISNQTKKFFHEMNTIWNKIPDSKSIRDLVVAQFDSKLTNLVSEQEEEKQDMNKRLMNYETQRVKTELDELLFIHQDTLNNHLGRIQFDIENRIEINEYKSAMQRLHTKLNKINEVIRQSDKSLKQNFKKITSKAKTSKGKTQFLMRSWKRFIDEYKTVVKEKQLNLELLILERYIQKVILAFKDEYIPLNYLSKEFRLKRDLIQERLITLIGEKRLPGKLYLELMIYYENKEHINKLDKASVEMIKTSNVNTYLVINRIRRVAKQIYPILMVVGSILTIILSAVRIVQQAALEWWVIPAAFGVLLVFLLMYLAIKRKDRNSGKGMDD